MRGRYCYVLGVNLAELEGLLLHPGSTCYTPRQSPRPLELWAGGLYGAGLAGAYRGRLRRSIHPNKSSRHSSASMVPPTPTIPTT